MQSLIADVDVSRETFDGLIQFQDLVRKWTPKINLISTSTLPDIWDRHVVDSVQIYRYAPIAFAKWLDIGSGGGFPGIVMAIIGKDKNPSAQFELVESDQRKATFLRTAIRELGLNAIVTADRIENIPSRQADVVTARALGSLPVLLPLVFHHIAPHGLALLHKGRQAGQEIAQVGQDWRFDLEEMPSFTDPDARILLIKRLSRAA